MAFLPHCGFGPLWSSDETYGNFLSDFLCVSLGVFCIHYYNNEGNAEFQLEVGKIKMSFFFSIKFMDPMKSIHGPFRSPQTLGQEPLLSGVVVCSEH